MPVDPEIKDLLEQISALGEMDLNEIPPQKFRELFDSSGTAMNPDKPEVSDTRDFEIPVKQGVIKARMYMPDESGDSLIVFFHGGGFVIGNIETHDNVCRLICRNSGVKVLSIDYRLAPEYKFPTAVEDAFDSYKWVLDNSSNIGVEKGKIALAGDSAGGNLCASISIQCRDNGIQLPRLQMLFYPVVTADVSSQSYRDFGEGLFLTAKMSSWFMKQYITSREDLLDPRYNILFTDDLSGLPETIVVTAEYDTLRDQGETFVSRLRSSGTPATGVRALGMVHGFLSFFNFSKAASNYLIFASKFIGSELNP